MRRILIGAGIAVMGYALAGVVTSGVNLVGVGIFLVAVLVLHDAVFLPLVIAVGALSRRFVPRRWRGSTVAAGIVSLAVSVVAVPLLTGAGRSADNPSILPGSYGPGLLGVLAVTWIFSFLVRRARFTRVDPWIGAAAGLVIAAAAAVVQTSRGMTTVDATGLTPSEGTSLACTVLGGALIGFLLRHRPGRLPALVATGVLAGLLWWAVEWLTVLPLLAGHRVTWSLVDAQSSFGFLAAGMIQGGLIALVVQSVGAVRTNRVPADVSRAAVRPEVAVRPRVVVVGGGFAGVSVARRLARGGQAEVVLVSDSNYLLFTPMLAGVAGGTVHAQHIGAPVRAIDPAVRNRHAALESVDAERRVVTIRPEGGDPVELGYDHLVLAVGATTGYHDIPGADRHAFPLKTLPDAVRLREHVIRQLERADVEPDPDERRRRLTIVVAGGGFAGAELVAELRDMVHAVRRYFPDLDPDELRFLLVHSQNRILPELDARLADHALRRLRAKGIDVRLSHRVAEIDPHGVRLDDGTEIPAATVVWTAGTAPNPIVRGLGLELDHGAIACDTTLRVRGHDRIWAVGDCAAIPDPRSAGRRYPPTAQHALREGKVLADNIAAVLRGVPPRPFRFRTIGLLVALGHQDGAAQFGGRLISGRLAWLLWRTIYLTKLPGGEKRIRVAIDWTLDLFFPRDVVLSQPQTHTTDALTPAGGER